jgi:trans-2,3-dihydro-3-hydroxyanthranilate isomerase
MRSLRIHHIDSFTSHIFGGNPTVTVFDAEVLSDEEMKQIAREMNLSETGFVLPSSVGDFRLRYFTRDGTEVKFCGHATVGALYAIEREKEFGVENDQHYTFDVETNIGVLKMEIDLTHPEGNYFQFMAPKIDLVEAPHTAQELADALGINPALIDLEKPVMVERTHNYLYLTAASLDALGKVTINSESAIEFSKRDGTVLYSILTPEAFDPNNQVHARCFAPQVGVHEDPFTGSAQGGLIAYLLHNGMIPADQEIIRSEQGHFLGRPGHVEAQVLSRDPLEVQLHAEAVHVFSTDIHMI